MTSRNKSTYCCVYGCLNKSASNPELSFFSIPTEYERRSKWLRLIGREDLTTKVSYHYVCQIHFEAQDVQVNTHRKLLKKTSLPCFFLPALEKEDKATQSDLPTSCNVSTQTDGTNLQASSTSSQTEKKIVSDNVTQTAASLSANTPHTRKLKAELSECKKRLKLQVNSKKAQRDMFHKLSDRFLTKKFAKIVKAQIRVNSCNRGNRYTQDYKMFCLNLYHVSPQAYEFLQEVMCLPCKSTLSNL